MARNYHDLPVYQHRSEIVSALEQHQVLIVESPTGSGKTTQLPLILYEAGYTERGMIGITQPRRIATLSVCDFISQQLQVPLGGFVGYKMRFEDVTSPATQIKVMTDGTLLQELKHDPLLLRYSVMMIDEAHERSLTIDFILGLLKDILPKRPDMRLLVSSATIRTEIFSQYFHNAPVTSIQAESFPVQVIYRPPAPNPSAGQAKQADRTKAKGSKATAPSLPSARLQMNPAEEQALQICDLILQLEQQDDPNSKGDVLVFLPGEANIKACLAALLPYEEEHGIYTLPLYARLGKEEQQRIFEDAPLSPRHQRPCRKVILATNIAETSITIDGVTVVIDTGLAKLSHFDSYSQHSELRESGISKASAEQRKGRAGRVAPGRCYRLYSRASFQAMRPYTQEEIQRTDLTEVILRMAELGIRGFEDFDFLTKPGINDIRNAIDSLVQLGALEPQSRQLTEIGKQMCYFPLLPRHSRILIEAVRISLECIHPACVITAFLSTNSPFLLPHGQEREAREAHARFMGKYGDFDFYLRIYSHYCAVRDLNEKLQFCERYFLDQRAMHELQRIVEQLKEIIRNSPPFADIAIPEPANAAGASGGKGTALQQHSPRYCEEYTRACLVGLQSGLCIQEEEGRDKQKQRRKRRVVYRSLTTRNIIIHPGSSMSHKPSKYLLAGEIMRTSQTYARSAALVEAQWIDNFDPDLRRQLEQAALQRNDKYSDAEAKSTKSEKRQASQKNGKTEPHSGGNAAANRSARAEQRAAYYRNPESYLSDLAQQSSKGWQIEGEELLWLEQRFPLLNKAKLLRNIRNYFGAAKPRNSKSSNSKHQPAGAGPHLVPHIKADIEQLSQAHSAGLLPDIPPELGILLQFQGRLVVDGLMLSDLYQLFAWQPWDVWSQNSKQLVKEQSKLRSSYDAAKGRAKAERKALLKSLNLLFSPLCLSDKKGMLENGILGIDTDAEHTFWFRPFYHFSELLQASCLALEALADLIERDQQPEAGKGRDALPLPEELQCWLDRCETMF